MSDRQRIRQQTEAEFAFAHSLERDGVDPESFMQAWGLTLHQFNQLAQALYGVSDETTMFPPALRAFLRAAQEAAHTTRVV